MNLLFRLADKASSLPKKVIIEMYWRFCWEVDPHNFNILKKVFTSNVESSTNTDAYVAFLIEQAEKQGKAVVNVFIIKDMKTLK